MTLNGYKWVRLGLVLVVLASLFGCSVRSFPLLYRQPIMQGNRVTTERFEQVKLGMTRQQVKLLLGSPSFIDPFHPDRWDYYFSLDTGKKTVHNHTMVLFFTDDKLVRIEGEPAQGERISELLKS